MAPQDRRQKGDIMAKWADYGISAVKYDTEKRHIVAARVHVDKGETIESGAEWKRTEVVSAIERGNTFVTILKNAEGKWKKGESIGLVEVNGKKYIRTDANKKESDNLGELPTF
jgi:hypothetical protein